MITEQFDVHCPNCQQTCFISCSMDEKPNLFGWRNATQNEVTCRCCSWEFIVDQEGEIIDDGEVEQEAIFEINEEGELSTETLTDFHCPQCQRRLDVEDPGVVCCPWCHASSEAREPELPDEEDVETLYYEGEPESMDGCPMCGDQEGSDWLALDNGWVKCLGCRAAFWKPNVWQESHDRQRESLANHSGKRRWVVAGDGTGDAAEFADIEDSTGPTGRIVVRPGEYQIPDYLSLQTLLVAGDGPVEQIRLLGTLKLSGQRMVLRGLTLSRGIIIDDSRVTLEGCTIMRGRFAAVDITGAHSKVTMRQCRIVDSPGHGVRIMDRAVCRLIDCEIAGNAANGIHVQDDSWLRVRKSRLHHNGKDGLCSLGKGAVFVHHCEIADNRAWGIRLVGSRSVISHTQVRGPHEFGVSLSDAGCLFLRDVQIAGSRRAGLQVDSAAKLLAVELRAEQNRGLGVALGSRARARLRKCRVLGNHVGIALTENTTLYGDTCEIHGNQRDWEIAPGARVIHHSATTPAE